MAKNTVHEAAETPHTLTLSNRSSMQLTGISEMLGFDETLVTLKTGCGRLNISGKELHILSLLPQEGRVEISGQISDISYCDQSIRPRRFLRDIFR